jgi:uncharacterized protein YndB with AHSA1/START domain
MDATEDLGAISRTGEMLQGRLQRTLTQDQQAVWDMLTVPEKFAQWIAPGTMELRLGGAVKIHFADSGTVIDSAVTAFDAQRLIEYSWSSPGQPSRPVRWEIQPAGGGGTTLLLTVSVPQGEDIARTCAGWEAHLMMLLAAIEGVPIKFPFERFKATREAYKAKAAALG